MQKLDNWEAKGYYSWMQEDYKTAAQLYESAISARPEITQNYWHLGLMLLLQGQEEEAHGTWLMAAIATEDEEELEQETSELVQILETEAIRQQAKAKKSLAWLIRQHLREIAPKEPNNLLHLIQLAIEMESLTEEDLANWSVVEVMQEIQQTSGDRNATYNLSKDLLLQVLEKLFEFAPLHPYSRKLAEACLPYFPQNLAFRNVLLEAAIAIASERYQYDIAIALGELCLQIGIPKPRELLRHLSSFYNSAGNYYQAIETAKQCYDLCESLPDKIFANYLIVEYSLGAGGYWEEASRACERQESLILSLLENPPTELKRVTASRLISSTFVFPYFRDEPQQNREIHNRVAALVQPKLQADAREKGYCPFEQSKFIKKAKKAVTEARPLKIGYISNCLRKHSVGWLARGLFQYCDRSRFEIHGYFVNPPTLGDPLQAWYEHQVFRAHKLRGESWEIAQQIARDKIDILVDIDSLTTTSIVRVMALKPAPIQVTWLGWDATGLPAVDYFIADPYVLPHSAQNCYAEKIWRLPQTYIAVDGFEVGIPTLRRQDLDIPPDAVVYLSGQSGYKRHRDTAQLQMKILKQVPNSYFAIKGKADTEAVKNFFTQLAEEEGVSGDRLRFLPRDPSEPIHRANLGIADVVLDTYPYNGATTTMETLWMGIPLVTRVGEQFAARNSYAMIANTEVTEGIARTDEEYLEWGVRFGLDPNLRKQISWKLRHSRQTSPLWNAKQFTREMESAYEKMWQIYLDARC